MFAEEIGEGVRRGGVITSVAIIVAGDFEVSPGGVVTDEFDRDGVRSRSAAVLEGQQEPVTLTHEVGGGIRPSVQVCAAAKRLTELRAGAFAHVVDDGDGGAVLALQVTQEAEQCRDLGGTIFVDLMQADERVEQDEAGLELGQGGVEAALVVGGIESQGRGGDDVQRESADVEAAVFADASDAAADLVQRVLGEIDEGRTWELDLEAIEARGVAGDGDGEVETEPAFAALRGPSDETDSLVTPEGADEPRWGAVDFFDVSDASGW